MILNMLRCISENLKNFKIQNVELVMKNLCLTQLCIDYEEDYIFIKQIIDKLG